MPKKKNETPVPKPKHRRPNRKRFKKQITVRVDEELLKAALTRAAEQDPPLCLTEAVEAGLWLFLQAKKGAGPEPVLRGRFLWNVIPQRLQRLTTGFWPWISNPRPALGDECFRRSVEKLIDAYIETPEYTAELQTLVNENRPEEPWPEPKKST